MILLSTATGEVVSDFQNKKDGEGGNFLFSEDGSQIVDSAWKTGHVVRTLVGEVVFQEAFPYEMTVRVCRHPRGRFWFLNISCAGDPNDETRTPRLIGRDLPFGEGVYEQLPLPTIAIKDFDFSSDGDSVAILSGSSPPFCIIVNTFPGLKEIERIDLPEGFGLGRRLRFSPCGRFLIAAGSKMFAVFSARDLSLLRQFEIYQACDIAFSTADSLVAVGSWSTGAVFTLDEISTPKLGDP